MMLKPRPRSSRCLWIARCLAGFVGALAMAPGGEPIIAQERAALVSRGKALFIEKGCPICHRIGHAGGSVAPDLSHAGARYREGDLASWLRNPPAQEPTPGARFRELGPVERDGAGPPHHMPALTLSETEAQALAAYLASLP
jgi:mono/diheme cytochrome c family protein